MIHQHEDHHDHIHARHDSNKIFSRDHSLLEPPPADAKRMLEWHDISLQFEGKQVLNNVSAWVRNGELTCLCGSNGAGKTQLIRVSLGLISPQVGRVTLLGSRPEKSRHRVGYVPQLKAFNRNFPASVEDVLIAAMRGSWPLFVRKSERDLAAASLQKVGGLSLLDKDMSVLSGGELQRVFMARSLLQNPELLILDEPLAAIDTKGRAQLMDLMEELRAARKITLLLITHSELVVRRLADRVIFIEKGRVVGWGETNRILAVDALREVAFFGHDHESAIHGEEG